MKVDSQHFPNHPNGTCTTEEMVKNRQRGSDNRDENGAMLNCSSKRLKEDFRCKALLLVLFAIICLFYINLFGNMHLTSHCDKYQPLSLVPHVISSRIHRGAELPLIYNAQKKSAYGASGDFLYVCWALAYNSFIIRILCFSFFLFFLSDSVSIQAEVKVGHDCWGCFLQH